MGAAGRSSIMDDAGMVPIVATDNAAIDGELTPMALDYVLQGGPPHTTTTTATASGAPASSSGTTAAAAMGTTSSSSSSQLEKLLAELAAARDAQATTEIELLRYASGRGAAPSAASARAVAAARSSVFGRSRS